ncbi:cleft lip and palate transmembrane 1 [Rhizodiscina lignyota]|uniref:Cleft lip and palate transmembrane 1 n=1 Tax=Rhizodiscina lignyota TaxID=1504668 RepID=A0A9P4IE05_9PEZI|nr:cleft lip and palate transmembrane 1 [Rhizodiscina lignyota]
MPEAAPARQEEQQGSGMMWKIVQSVGMFFLIQFAMKQFMPSSQSSNSTSSGAAPKAAVPAFDNRPAALDEGAQYYQIPQSIAPIWPQGTSLDISMYISPSIVVPSLKSMPSEWRITEEKEMKLGDYSDKRVIDAVFPVPKEVQHNGTLWAHFFVAQSGSQLDPSAPDYNVGKAFHYFRPLTQHLKKKKVKKVRNLLAGKNDLAEEEEPEEADKGPQVVSYYHPNFTISLIPDSGTVNYPAMQPALRQFIVLERTGARDASGANGWYYPIVYVNTFWQLRDHMTELNDTVKELPIHIDLNNQANWKFSLFASIDEGMKMNAHKAAAEGTTLPGGGDGSEFEEFKRILLDSNPILLSTTFVVSILHTIFEMLAFKNDVSHWRKKKDNVGTSFRTILANVFMQGVIFLYLMDNNENTSWMILFGQGMGIAIEAWKITKTVNVRIRQTEPSWKTLFLPYAVVFEDKHVLSETEKKTQEYDEIAFKYLYMVAVPLLLAYAVYSLNYESHKSWYSFIITTLVGSVYAYGFLMMVPSLYINYRLKSVAHMPGRAMAYKFLNTFIDDLFAYTIKMPTLHRLATLRDDVIFFIYLYQMWAYKVDYGRVNEFGQGGDEEESEEKTANKPLTAPPDADGKVKEAIEDIKEADAKATGVAKGQGSSKKRK